MRCQCQCQCPSPFPSRALSVVRHERVRREQSENRGHKRARSTARFATHFCLEGGHNYEISCTPQPIKRVQQTSRNGTHESAIHEKVASSSNTLDGAVWALWHSYAKTTPPLLKLIDTYLVFMLMSGIIQFVYVLLAGNYPFNAFLASFGNAVASFVLGVSLRMQCNPENKGSIQWNPHRALAHFVIGQILLQFITVHFLG
ncbi:DAD family-domain-containing protein [Catenaria anguillulae PL171]|uniref:Dolichyl-diphosphooligosaccharide--protein glycosyltransferase subunit OST2 n=1 Tax=Catenaria anguillulae PL171 TaxID=765915 RepID=A0A1Y2HLE5_9FUNG|nr:DAD family-domain-containing protein [Catenaria anguillulae PL171]